MCHVVVSLRLSEVQNNELILPFFQGKAQLLLKDLLTLFHLQFSMLKFCTDPCTSFEQGKMASAIELGRVFHRETASSLSI